MMRHSSLLKWTQRNKNGGNNKHWIHPPEALQCGHIAYLVKFLGYTEVDSPKGIDVVKEGIRKLKFNQQLRRSEGGTNAAKIPKVEVTVSVDGVAIQEPKLKRIYHQYPLHRISYCADDKTDKKFFSFIAKEEDSDKHTCFVFVSDKLAEEITLTIGQAFDLAYKKFLETSGRDLEMRKQMMLLQKKIQTLESDNQRLQQRIRDLESLKDKEDVDNYKKSNNIVNLSCLTNGTCVTDAQIVNDAKSPERKTVTNSTGMIVLQPPPIPPRSGMKTNGIKSPTQDLCDISSSVPEVGRKLENLSLDDLEDFNPRAEDNVENKNEPSGTNGFVTGSVNGNHVGQNVAVNGTDLFGAKPFSPKGKSSCNDDPFRMGKFEEEDLENAIGALDRRITEMRDGFSRGLSFGNDDFSLESLDPLSSKAQ